MPDILAHLAAHAAERPDHPAVIADSKTLTYAAFFDRASRLAAAIAKHDERPKVLVHLPQGADAYCAMFATTMAGGFYAPTNVAAPVAKQRRIVQEFAPDVVVTTRDLFVALLQGHRGSRPVLVEPAEAQKESPLAEARAPHDLAYVIFTSGSTGEPKGVMVPQRALAHFVNWALAAMQVNPTDRWSQHPNIAFDLSVLDIYGALCGGATLFPLDRPTHRLMPARAIRELGLTIWNSVPSVIDLIMRAGQVRSDHLESLRLMTFCGEPLLVEHVDALFAVKPDFVVHNTYGPTEATVSCTLQRLTAEDYRNACRDTVALGNAIPGMALHLVPDKSTGRTELAITGPQLAQGYWNDPESTAAAFRPLQVNGAILTSYYTGDLVERIDDHLYFVGRRDSQVKMLGRRLELEEVNAALRRCGYLSVASVVIEGELHAFLEVSSEIESRALRARLAELLEPHAIPSRIHSVHRLPRNANDKVDLQALSALGTRGVIS